MKRRITISFIILSVFIFGLSFGCARHATSDAGIVEIENKISLGMPESEFRKSMPSAQLIHEQENKKVYVVLVSEPCFICGSAKGFQRSFETYATQLTFEDGKLASFKRIVNGS